MIRTRNLASSSIDAGQEPVGASEEARMTVRNVGPSMTLANMRENGPRAVTAKCEACGRQADVNVDALPESVHVPDAGRYLRCSRCNAKRVSTRPAWHTARRQGVPDLRERP